MCITTQGFQIPEGITAELAALLYATPQNEARDDGRLVVAPEALWREAGIKWPVRLTRAAWERHVAVTPAAAKMLCDENGRLWDLFTMFKWYARRSDEALIGFEFLGVADVPKVQKHRLYALIAPDEHERPTIVFATPEEVRGAKQGMAIRRYLALQDPYGEDDDEDPADLGDARAW